MGGLSAIRRSGGLRGKGTFSEGLALLLPSLSDPLSVAHARVSALAPTRRGHVTAGAPVAPIALVLCPSLSRDRDGDQGTASPSARRATASCRKIARRCPVPGPRALSVCERSSRPADRCGQPWLRPGAAASNLAADWCFDDPPAASVDRLLGEPASAPEQAPRTPAAAARAPAAAVAPSTWRRRRGRSTRGPAGRCSTRPRSVQSLVVVRCEHLVGRRPGCWNAWRSSSLGIAGELDTPLAQQSGGGCWISIVTTVSPTRPRLSLSRRSLTAGRVEAEMVSELSADRRTLIAGAAQRSARQRWRVALM